jgi:hypothetical protein
MYALTVIAMNMELGVLGVTLFSLLSELGNPHLSISKTGSAYQKKRKEVVATSVSIVASSVTLGITILGSGDFLSGVRKVGGRMSAASRAVLGMPVDVLSVPNRRLSSRKCSHRQLSSRNCSQRQLSSRNSFSAVEDVEMKDKTGSESRLSQNGERQSSSAMHVKGH